MKGCTAKTARGETNSAQMRRATKGAAMPTTMFHGNDHATKPHSAREPNARSSHTKAARSSGVSGARVPGAGSAGFAGVTRGVSDMRQVYGGPPGGPKGRGVDRSAGGRGQFADRHLNGRPGEV